MSHGHPLWFGETCLRTGANNARVNVPIRIAADTAEHVCVRMVEHDHEMECCVSLDPSSS